ncbi:hypothetical protein AU187_17585 [Mycobacterium sp. IS-1556]|nr:hypothetical protein AU187_17585 [Mycobacterium sp. IS-1556]
MLRNPLTEPTVTEHTDRRILDSGAIRKSQGHVDISDTPRASVAAVIVVDGDRLTGHVNEGVST